MFAHRTRPLAVAASSLAAVALVLTGCSADGDDSAAESSSSAATTTQLPEGTGNAFGADTSLVDKLLAQEEAPGGSTVEPARQDMVTTYVQGRQAIRDADKIFGDACDETLRGDFASDHLLTDAAINQITFDGEQRAVMVVLAPGRLDDFLAQDKFSCESGEIPRNEVPGAGQAEVQYQVRMTMSTEDGPQVEGAEAFTETRDVITSGADGSYRLERNLIIHGFAADTTIDVSFTGVTDKADADPITPENRQRLQDVFTAQVEKLTK